MAPILGTAYYVRKTGSDTTGDGSINNPWLTVDKAIKTVPIAGGNTILVGDGVYNEVSGANNYFQISRLFQSLQVVRPESGRYGSVTLRGNGDATYNVWFNAAVNIRFENFNLSPVSGASRAVLFVRAGGTAISNLQFFKCNLPGMVEVNVTAGSSYTGLLFDGCTISQGSAGNYALQLGTDGVALGTIAGTVKNCRISGNNHVLLVGGDCNSVTVDNNTINATNGIYGIVMKECRNTTVKNNTFSGGSVTSVYCKAALVILVNNNQISSAQNLLLQVGNNAVTGNKCQNITFTNNVLNGTGSSSVFNWSGDTGDLGGGVCDYNTYTAGGTGKFGAVRADLSVIDLVELRAAWVGYGDGTNDSHSTVI